MIKLVDKQLEVVNKDGLIVLTACPGSGKTTVVACRVNRIINTKRLKTYQGVLSLSFTNIAQQSVLKQYKELTSVNLKFPNEIATIDSFIGSHVFRPFSHKLTNSCNQPFKILSVNSQWLNDIYPKLNQFSINGQNIIYTKNGELICQGVSILTADKKRYIQYVKEDMFKKRIVTQSDVNYFSYKLLLKYPFLIENLIRRYPFIIVDETQDCSETQMAIIDLLVNAGHKEIMLVGDPYQAIYEWRDAEPQLFIDKERQPGWQRVELLISQRSGPEICKLLNLFHDKRKINHNPARTELLDAEVKIVSNDNIHQVIKEFLSCAKSKGIEINENNIAVLYGGHKSNANLNKLNIDPISIWKTDFQKIYSLILLGKIFMEQKKYEKAYDQIFKYYYFEEEGKQLISNDDLIDHRLSEINNRVLLWKFCKSIPSLQMNLDEWIIKVNKLINQMNTKLGIKSPKLSMIYKKRGEKNKNLKESLFSNGSKELLADNITMENIHQIKGRTFGAVMLYVDSGSGNYKISINKIEAILKHKDLFNGKYHEEGRCVYVGCSRARRLLWIVGKDKKIESVIKMN